MEIEPFNDWYFKHYAWFDKDKKTPYSNSMNRFAGNLAIPVRMLELFLLLFKRNPRTYIDLGCGSGLDLKYYSDNYVQVSGCEISKYALDRLPQDMREFVKEQDSLTYMRNFEARADVLFDSTLQYVDNPTFDKLLKQISQKTAHSSVVGILYDDTERYHPYRKQVHSKDWWIQRMSEAGFDSLDKVNYEFTNKKMYTPFIFVKRGAFHSE